MTRVYYLEDPELAAPVDVAPDTPVESIAANVEAAVRDARQRGRLVLVARIGQRTFTESELAAQSIPGTVFMPGDRMLPVPALPPTLPAACYPSADPILGQRATLEECFHDGGDVPPKLGLGPDGKLGGLDPSDTALEFRLGNGQKRVCTSNRVKICVPRFGAVRVEAQPEGVNQPVGPAVGIGAKGPELARSKVLEQELTNKLVPVGFQGSKRPSQVTTVEGLLQLQKAKTFRVIGTVNGTQRLLAARTLRKCGRLRASSCSASGTSRVANTRSATW